MLQSSTDSKSWAGKAMASYDTRSTTVHNGLAQREILRLTAPEAGLSLSHLAPMNFEHDMNFEGEAFLYVPADPPSPIERPASCGKDAAVDNN